ncbi:alpha/beta hydrolase fold domain-containing protein [Couchioplanes azureus]|uniref:alpha/beta hydrolase fold domain-containing protein n=1 Tax=Couchioplanes caeruleus TaxID=56438 RepID=UPI001670EFD8|nr:alpha/beta hydrolase fold domain-containing protein [Couchioplanes caeruleus]GGQ82999.1 hypothetical protein GCM10010166_61500 [Couchioplanes caeruleus subsp. azureus]
MTTGSPIVLEPVAQQVVDAFSKPPFLYDRTPADARRVLEDSATGTLPIIVYMHGGGWILGNAGTHDPPMCVDEADVLRDEGEAYAAKLGSAGVAVTAVRYHRTIHDFMLINALRPTCATRAAIDQAAAFSGPGSAPSDPELLIRDGYPVNGGLP